MFCTYYSLDYDPSDETHIDTSDYIYITTSVVQWLEFPP